MPAPALSTDSTTHIQTNDGSTAADTGSATTGAGSVTRDRVDAITPDGWNVTLGSKADTPATDDGASAWTVVQLLKRLLGTKLPGALGSAGGLKSEGTGSAGAPSGGILSTQGNASNTRLTTTIADTLSHAILGPIVESGVRRRTGYVYNTANQQATITVYGIAASGGTFLQLVQFSLAASTAALMAATGLFNASTDAAITPAAGAQVNLGFLAEPWYQFAVYAQYATAPTSGGCTVEYSSIT